LRVSNSIWNWRIVVFVIQIVNEMRFYYTLREDGYWYRWYENETTHPEFWEIVPWCGY